MASHQVPNLPGSWNQMVFSKGALFVRNVNLNYNYTSVVSETTGLLYRISTTDWASSVVVIPSNKPLLTADHWIYGSLFNFLMDDWE